MIEPVPYPLGNNYSFENNVTVLGGDCIEVLKSLADASVDSIVTDPPYGLEFMGKDWDSPWKGKASSEFTTIAEGTLGGFSQLPNHSRVNNVKCLSCDKWKFSSNPCCCAEPDFPNARLAAMKAFQVWCEEWLVECFRVLKPGGYLLAFGGTRVYHRLAVAVEDTGFEIRDSINWAYGTGFPKSLNVGKAIDKASGAKRAVVGKGKSGGTSRAYQSEEQTTSGEFDLTAPATDQAKQWEGWGTALKPSHEPIVVARKPLSEKSVAENVLAHGTGAINVDGCRVGFVSEEDRAESTGKNQHADFGTAPMTGNNTYGDWSMVAPKNYDASGRFPANTILTHNADCSVEGCTPGCPARLMDSQGETSRGKPSHEPIVVARKPLSEKSVAENVLAHGTGAINVDGCRVGSETRTNRGMSSLGVMHDDDWKPKDVVNVVNGRFPANTIFTHSPDCDDAECVDDCPVRLLDSQSGVRSAGHWAKTKTTGFGEFGGGESIYEGVGRKSGSGGASRYFFQTHWGVEDEFPPFIYQAKPSKRERNAGLGELPAKRPDGRTSTGMGTFVEKGVASQSNHHPTVKPVALIRYLQRLVTPAGGVTVDPFLGSGTSAVAAISEGFGFIGIEFTDEYLPIIFGRISHALEQVVSAEDTACDEGDAVGDCEGLADEVELVAVENELDQVESEIEHVVDLRDVQDVTEDSVVGGWAEFSTDADGQPILF